jgi:hypothetical protein
MDWLPSRDKIEERFNEMDDEIARRFPAIGRTLREGNHRAVDFVVRWELLLFADEHPLFSVFLLWDQILARRERAQRYVRALSLAHVGAVQVVDSAMIVCTLQTCSEWDPVAIVESANAIFDEPEGAPAIVVWPIVVSVVAVVVISAGVYIAIRRRRRR